MSEYNINFYGTPYPSVSAVGRITTRRGSRASLSPFVSGYNEYGNHINGEGAWPTIDTKNQFVVKRIRFMNAEPNANVKAFTLQGSNDKEKWNGWNDIIEYSNIQKDVNPRNPELQEYKFNNRVPYRYIRFKINKVHNTKNEYVEGARFINIFEIFDTVMLEDIKLESRFELGVNEQRRLPFSKIPDFATEDIMFSSDNPNVVTVDSKTGMLRGKSEGQTLVRVLNPKFVNAVKTVSVVTVKKIIRVYLSPSDQKDNKWSHYPYNESGKMIELSRLVKAYLEPHGFAVFGCRVPHEIEKRVKEDGKKENLVEVRIRESNGFKVDLHVALHSNGKMPNQTIFGPETFYKNGDKKSEEFSRIIQEKLFSLYKSSVSNIDNMEIKNRGIKTGVINNEFKELTETNATASYIEVAYHDHEDDEYWMDNNWKEIAVAIGEAIREYSKYAFNN